MITLIAKPSPGRITRAAAVPRLLRLGVVLAIALLGPAPGARADVTINFETPPFPTTAQPNNYNDAGPMQTYTQAGVFSINGGVVLGNPTFLPQFAGNGSPPNLYGTTDIADPSLLSTITLNLNVSQLATSVTGLLFNGQDTVATGTTESYTVAAFSGVTQVDSHSFALSTDLSSSSSLTTFSLSSSVALPITQVTVTTPDAATNGWDFLVDSIHVTTTLSTVPEPSTMVIVGMTLMFGLPYAWRRSRQATT